MSLFGKVLAASFVMMVAVSAQADMKMERKNIPELKLSIEIPQVFTPMPDDMAKSNTRQETVRRLFIVMNVVKHP